MVNCETRIEWEFAKQIPENLPNQQAVTSPQSTPGGFSMLSDIKLREISLNLRMAGISVHFDLPVWNEMITTIGKKAFMKRIGCKQQNQNHK